MMSAEILSRESGTVAGEGDPNEKIIPNTGPCFQPSMADLLPAYETPSFASSFAASSLSAVVVRRGDGSAVPLSSLLSPGPSESRRTLLLLGRNLL
jgi:hypothetical protein